MSRAEELADCATHGNVRRRTNFDGVVLEASSEDDRWAEHGVFCHVFWLKQYFPMLTHGEHINQASPYRGDREFPSMDNWFSTVETKVALTLQCTEGWAEIEGDDDGFNY